MNNPFDYTPDAACEEAFRKLLVMIDVLKSSPVPADANLCRELEAGKMLGVLIASDALGNHHILYAFSGQLGDAGFHHPGFVGPVFDYLQSDGYFKTKEAEISRRNLEIARFEKEVLAKAKNDYDNAKNRLDNEVAAYKEKCRLSKLERDAKRKVGIADEDMIRQSQFEKAELRRIKKRVEVEMAPFAEALAKSRARLEVMKEKRRSDSEALQDWLFSNFRLLNARGESRSLKDIFADTPLRIPPSGAGECCAPKLLHAAYKLGLRPVSMAEYWYGKPKGGELRIHGNHYPACRGKCLPVLGWMLEGLEVQPPLECTCGPTSNNLAPEIIYENEWFCVVNKPSGMLSVPGKGGAVSVQQWLSGRYSTAQDVKMAHRLDQDTSGLLIATFSPLAFKVMQTLFATRQVRKTYVALLEGDYQSHCLSPSGRIELPLASDWLDRPRQRVDFESGKEAVTDYEFTGISGGRSRVIFHPLTGRTHQLRVHAASEMGLGIPIAGDRLYGIHSSNRPQRLYLHAHRVEFTFPIDGKSYSFESPVPF